jgi:hypothetical protein
VVVWHLLRHHAFILVLRRPQYHGVMSIRLLALVLGFALEAERARAADEAFSFLGGVAVGLASHEAGHLAFDLAFDAHPRLAAVDYSGIPFFALTHDGGLPRRQEYLVAWAGLGVQHGLSEWILSRRPELIREKAPFAKGVLAFHVACSSAYGFAAITRTGPFERDTRSLADSSRTSEPWIGVLVLAPAAFDTYRYWHPEARWAKWASRVSKVALLALVLK